MVWRFAALHIAGQDAALAVFGITFMVVRLARNDWPDRFGARLVLVLGFVAQTIAYAGLVFATSTTASIARWGWLCDAVPMLCHDRNASLWRSRTHNGPWRADLRLGARRRIGQIA